MDAPGETPDLDIDINLDALTAWMAAVPSLVGLRATSAHRFPGGASNLTLRVDIALEQRPSLAASRPSVVTDPAAPSSVVLRIQRESGIFAPYDVVREGEVLRCLVGSGISVPAVLGSEPNPAILGAPFIVIEFIDAPHLGEARDPRGFAAFTATVACIHDLDWQALGLDFLAQPGGDVAGALAAELDAIARRLPSFGCAADPLLQRGLARLRTTTPTDGRLALCQGDINVFNYLVRDGEVVAVVDWEQARISDPRSDIGQLLALGHLKGQSWGPADAAPFVLGYAAAAGMPITGMAWFRARWLWELTAIWHGWRKLNGSDPWWTLAEAEGAFARTLDEL